MTVDHFAHIFQRLTSIKQSKRPSRTSTQLRAERLEDRRVLATLTVSTLDDVSDFGGARTVTDLPGPDGVTSLREAITASNNSRGIEFIILPTDTAGDIDLENGALNVTESITILGPASKAIALDGLNNDRIFNVSGTGSGAVELSLSNLTLKNGAGSGPGGAIYSDGASVTATRSHFQDNVSSEGGGAIYVEGINSSAMSVTIDTSTFNSNSSTAGGAVRVINVAQLFLSGSTFTNNSAPVGGALHVDTVDLAFLQDTNFTGNVSTFGGGGLYGINTNAFLTESTLHDNVAPAGGLGGGAYFLGSDVQLTDTQVTDNEAGAGSGVYLSESTATIETSVVQRNRGGYAVAGSASTIDVAYTTIHNNDGGVSNQGGLLNIDSSTISSNVFTPGITLAGVNQFGPLSIGHSTITNNYDGVLLRGLSEANEIRNSTITANVATGIKLTLNSASPLIIDHSIVAENGVSSSSDITANGSSAANYDVFYSIIGTNFGSGLSPASNPDVNGNRIGSAVSPIDPQLGPLANNGGLTKTRLPLAGSPAINAGSPAFDGADFDQRGADFDRITQGRVDIGSVELASETDVDGDFDDDGDHDVVDLDLLVANIASGQDNTNFDLDGDGDVNSADLDEWLSIAGSINLPSGNPYLYGDANLDGSVDGGDFLAWNSNKFSSVAAWSAGDFSADGNVDGVDLLIWNGNKFQSVNSNISSPKMTRLHWLDEFFANLTV